MHMLRIAANETQPDDIMIVDKRCDRLCDFTRLDFAITDLEAEHRTVNRPYPFADRQ